MKSILFLLLLLPTFIYGQFFISSHLEETAYFGPQNVSGNKTAISESYIELLSTAKKRLEEKYEQKQVDSDLLAGKKKLKRKDKKRLIEINELIEKLQKEIQLLDTLLAQWIQLAEQQNLLSKAVIKWQEGACMKFNTTTGILTADEIVFHEITDLNRLTYKEIIPIHVQPKGERWIKKKRDNCRSSNPDDCLVWCLVTGPGYRFTDMTQRKYDQEGCPAGMEYDTMEQFCSNTKAFGTDVKADKEFQLTDREGKVVYQLLDFDVIGCEE